MLKKVLSVFLCLIMAICLIPSAVLPVFAGEDTPTFMKIGNTYYKVSAVADPDTSTPPLTPAGTTYNINDTKGYFKTAGGDGRVWTDKTVKVASDKKSFDVVLSTIGQTYVSIEESTTVSAAQADVLLILDITQSMDGNDISNGSSGNMKRYAAMTNAANQAIDIIMNANPNNRIEVATFGNTSADNWGSQRVLLSLGSYKGVNGKYIQSGTSGTNKFKLSTVEGLKKADGSNITVKTINATSVGTQTQYSVYQAINHMINEVSGTASKKTIPYVLLLTDGNATRWDTGNIKTPSSPNSNSSGDQNGAAVTILTAAYWKDQLTQKYLAYNNKTSDPSLETRFFSIALSNDVDGYFNALISPKLLLSEYSEGETQLWNSNTGTRTIKGNISLSKSQAEEVANQINNYATGDLAKYKTTAGDKYIYTTDTFYYKATTVDGLNQAFTDLAESVREATKEIVTPITNTTIEDDLVGVEVKDVIGAGMMPSMVSDSVASIVAQTSSTDTYTMSSVSLKDEEKASGIVKKFEYTNSNYTMRVVVSKNSDDIYTITWEVPAELLPLYTKNTDNTAYVDALPLRLTYNVGLSEDAEEDINANKGGSFYSNKLSTETQGSAEGLYVPKTDNPPFL